MMRVNGRSCAIEAPAGYPHLAVEFAKPPIDLGKRVRQELANAVNERWLSPISTWEALTLHFQGRVVLSPNLPVWVETRRAQLSRGSLTHQIALVARELPLASPGSCGPLLVATAKVLGLTLVTADKTLLALSGISTLANL